MADRYADPPIVRMIPAKNLVNISLRGLTLGSRFLFVFFLARFISPENLGLYGLFSATVGYALYFVGLDFYTYATRAAIGSSRDEWGWMLKNQGALSIVMYLVFFPLSVALFRFDLLPAELFFWFFVILILEHINQEFGRFFIAVSEQLLSSLVLFFRQGSWAVLIVMLMLMEPRTRSLHFVLGAWAVGGIAAFAVGAYRLRGMRVGGWSRPLDWSWIKRGLIVCIPLLGATLALRGIQTLDRYWLQALVDTRTVGLYVLYMSIASTLLAFLDAGVFAYTYPVLIRCFQNNQTQEFKKQLGKMLILTITSCVMFSLVSLMLLPYLLGWIGNDFYLAHQSLYGWLLLSMVINSIGMVFHYALYAQGQDRPIIASHLASIVIFIAVTWAASQAMPLAAVPLGLVSAFSVILLWKSISYLNRAKSQFTAAIN